MPLSKERMRERKRKDRFDNAKNTGVKEDVKPKYKVIGGVRYHTCPERSRRIGA